MANSIHQQVTDTLIAALTNSTCFNYVSGHGEIWTEWKENQFPGLMVHTDEENRRRFSFPHPTSPDMYAETKILIVGYTKDATEDGRNLKGSNIIRDIETVIYGSTALADLVKDVFPVGFRTDSGTFPPFGIVHFDWLAKYVYNHATP
jgi:hypothetical protein